MADYRVGDELHFPHTGNSYVITKVDSEAATVTFAPYYDPDDEWTETIAELEAVDTQVRR